MTCLTCPTDLTSEGEPVPFPPSINQSYFQLNFLQNLLSLPQNSTSNFLHIFTNSSFCGPCASDLTSIIHTFKQIDLLHEKLTSFKESFQNKLIQGFLNSQAQNTIKIEPEIQDFKLKLITGLNLLPNLEEIQLANFVHPPEDSGGCHKLSPHPGHSSGSPNPHFEAPEDDNHIDLKIDNTQLDSHSQVLKELLIPLQRLPLPPNVTQINLKSKEYSKLFEKSPKKHKSTQKQSKSTQRAPLTHNWVFCTYPNCDYKGRGPKYLQNHVKYAHFRMGKKDIKCRICGEIQANKYQLEVHKNKVHFGRKWICSICGREYSREKMLKYHMKSHDEEVTKKRNQERNYKCQVEGCGKSYFKKDYLKTHVERAHSGHRPICQICGMDFQILRSLQSHISTVHEGKRKDYLCPICGKVVHYLPSFREHMAVHAKKSPYPCPECPQGFDQKNDLETHQKSHESELKPHKCRICKKGFRVKGWMVQHEKIHSQQSEYFCERCGKGFKLKKYLTRHLGRKIQCELKNN